MSTNFGFLKEKNEYKLFAKPCMEAENTLTVSAAVSAFASRRALELCVKWIYAADSSLEMYGDRETLQDLLHDHGFPSLMDNHLWRRLQQVVRSGNESAHSGGQEVTTDRAILSLNILFDLVQWIDYCYGRDYEERKFSVKCIPSRAREKRLQQENFEKQLIEAREESDRVFAEKEKQIEALLAEITELKAESAGQKKKRDTYVYRPDLSEAETRRRYIDADLEDFGYDFYAEDGSAPKNCIQREYPVTGMPNATGTGFADYVIWGDTGKIIAVIEAKKASESAGKGKTQAILYANCIENMQGFRPVMFWTNGFETWFLDDRAPFRTDRQVSSVFPQRDIERLLSMRLHRKSPSSVSIDQKITDRHYQIRAVSKCCEEYEKGRRACLLVMATGTGKTRTAASLVDVLKRSGYVQRMLFLADRIELVRQAKYSFGKNIPDTPSCNLLTEREERDAEFVFSTYPTMLHAIDNEKNSDGTRFFTPQHFDLIIVDEAHRSIFNKYRAIFDYFDSCLLGLTATPKNTVDQSTYRFFGLPVGIPTDVYEYEEAVEKDKVLVPYYPIETGTALPEDGLHYSDLSETEREEYEEEFTEDGVTPDRIPAAYINKYIFNRETVDLMLSDLMQNGIRSSGQNHVGKTILFAQNRLHADFIIERFMALYPEYGQEFICKIMSGVSYSEELYDQFKKKTNTPFIAVTVDKLETGVDIPEVVNLVFAKKVYSRIKFDQMLGRGTRLCRDLFGEGEDKKEFRVFDYMRNFQFFDLHPKGKEIGMEKSPVAMRFARQVEIIELTQNAEFSGDEYQRIRSGLVETVVQNIQNLQTERVEVHLKKRFVEKYKDPSQFTALDDTKKAEINGNLADLIISEERDEAAISFDVTMYGLMIHTLSSRKADARQKRRVQDYAERLLDRCATIPEVKERIPELKEVTTDLYWDRSDMLRLEETRQRLRTIMHLVMRDAPQIHYTDFSDEVVFRTEGREINIHSDDFEDYRKKVNRYVDENRHNTTIHKLLYNEPITEMDQKELERIFTEELGTKEDYFRSYQETPIGILIRKIAKMDRESAYAAFGTFIAEKRPNAEQIHFIEKVVDYVVENGCINEVRDLMKTPFDRPQKFTALFTVEEQKKIVEIVDRIRKNATTA